jgi:hypothetical protein
VVDKGSLAVDLHDGQPLAVAGLELRMAGDVHLCEIELDLLRERGNRLLRTLAEVAAGRVE